MRLEIGQIIRTSYDTGPYEIMNIIRDCICPSYLDTINMDDPPNSKPHCHLTLKDIDIKKNIYVGRGYSNLNGYDEKTLKSVWDDDHLILCKNKKLIQLSIPI